ncbi:tRNA-splicing endonuclease positive [Cyclospora cayetanensis]|uniref:tRNA-splicing endonuclease positive n=1 Tax=Cyclospora cayetanensis TaxID=88456 RepID=A0A1D3DB79_9EIME|nr:tRNA-splicing endonuclease positive [Cyclospora cayetanensis]
MPSAEKAAADAGGTAARRRPGESRSSDGCNGVNAEVDVSEVYKLLLSVPGNAEVLPLLGAEATRPLSLSLLQCLATPVGAALLLLKQRLRHSSEAASSDGLCEGDVQGMPLRGGADAARAAASPLQQLQCSEEQRKQTREQQQEQQAENQQAQQIVVDDDYVMWLDKDPGVYEAAPLPEEALPNARPWRVLPTGGGAGETAAAPSRSDASASQHVVLQQELQQQQQEQQVTPQSEQQEGPEAFIDFACCCNEALALVQKVLSCPPVRAVCRCSRTRGRSASGSRSGYDMSDARRETTAPESRRPCPSPSVAGSAPVGAASPEAAASTETAADGTAASSAEVCCGSCSARALRAEWRKALKRWQRLGEALAAVLRRFVGAAGAAATKGRPYDFFFDGLNSGTPGSSRNSFCAEPEQQAPRLHACLSAQLQLAEATAAAAVAADAAEGVVEDSEETREIDCKTDLGASRVASGRSQEVEGKEMVVEVQYLDSDESCTLLTAPRDPLPGGKKGACPATAVEAVGSPARQSGSQEAWHVTLEDVDGVADFLSLFDEEEIEQQMQQADATMTYPVQQTKTLGMLLLPLTRFCGAVAVATKRLQGKQRAQRRSPEWAARAEPLWCCCQATVILQGKGASFR